jgi:hypothetical protein
MDTEAEDAMVLKAATKQSSEDCEWEHQSVCDSDLESVVTSCVFKSPINPITNPNPMYRHSSMWQFQFQNFW